MFSRNIALISSLPFTALLIRNREESKNIFLLGYRQLSFGWCFCVLGLQKMSRFVKQLSYVLQIIYSCWVSKCALHNFLNSTSQIWIEHLYREVTRFLSASIRLVFMQCALASSSMCCRSCVAISPVPALSWPIGHSFSDVIPSRWKINNFAAVNYKLRSPNAFSDHALFLTCCTCNKGRDKVAGVRYTIWNQ